MPATLSLAGNRATDARADIPRSGVWFAEATLDSEVTLTGAADLVMADLTLKGTILSGGPEKGKSRYRLIGGKGRWGKPIPKKAYPNDAGSKYSAIVIDAAEACGETVDASTIPDKRTAENFVRPEGAASLVLEELFPSGWYVGEDGVTRIGARPTVQFTGQAQHGEVDRAARRVQIASESIATILPGLVVDGFTAVDVMHEASVKTGLRSTVWGAGIFGEEDREVAALRRIFDLLEPNRRFRELTEYRVVSQEDERLNLQPVRTARGMPNLKRVYVRPSLAGARHDYKLSSRVLVGFIEADPSRPFVAFAEDADGAGFKPTKTEIDADAVELAGGILGVARLTDTVQAGPFSGAITSASMKVKSG